MIAGDAGTIDKTLRYNHSDEKNSKKTAEAKDIGNNGKHSSSSGDGSHSNVFSRETCEGNECCQLFTLGTV